MDPTYAAKVFLSWAHSEGLASLESAPQPVVAPPPPHPLNGVSLEGKTILRDRIVQCVAANVPEHEIVVFLKKAAPKAKKTLEKLPGFVDDVAIKYRQGVTSPTDPNAPAPFGGPPYALKQVGNVNFYTCGSSISVGNFREAGTLGALIKNQAGKLYGLSNSHVVSSCNQAAFRTPIVAPGVADVCAANQHPFTIGAFSSGLPLISGSPDTVAWTDNCDAAIFEVTAIGSLSSWQQSFYDTPAATSALVSNMAVEKVGRTTGHTLGKVIGAIPTPFLMPYHAAAYDFRGHVYLPSVFVVEGIGKVFSDSGDSGSLVVHTDVHGVRTGVGLIFGGMQSSSAPGGSYSLILPLEPILQKMGMQLVSGHNA